jgi:hypothetical protein
MLGSITPLGERGRGRVWGRTVIALIAGGALGGVLIGALAGGVGETVVKLLHPSEGARVYALAAVLAAAFLMDVAGKIPTPRRQVNEDWLNMYRDWVYGLGFGVQLGSGLATIVTTASIFALVGAAALAGSVATGALVGGAFGLLRTATVLLGMRVSTFEASAALALGVERLERPAKIVTAAALASLSVAALALGVRA